MYTIEAALVMSAILMILFAMIFAFMLLYQNVVIMYSAYSSTQQGAEDWAQNNGSIYYRVGEITGGGGVQGKLTKIEESAKEKLKAGILPSNNNSVKAEFKNGFIQKKVVIKIEQSIPIPIFGIAKYFGAKDVISLSAESSAVISEPMEYIRNLDFCLELINKSGITDAFGKITEGIKGVFD